MDSLQMLMVEIGHLIDRARELNKEGTDTRSRQLSLAITKLEEAKLWLHDVLDEIPF